MAGKMAALYPENIEEELSLARDVTEFLRLVDLDQGLILYLCDLKKSLFDLFLLDLTASS